MPTNRLPIYLRTHRLKWGLSQPELGHLLGVSKDTISKYERGTRTPPTKIILSVQIVFGANARLQFPAMHRVVENELIERIILFEKRLGGTVTNARVRRKFELLQSISQRLYELEGDSTHV